MGFARWPVAGFVVAMLVSVAGVAGGLAPRAGADCPDVQLIFARGTNEPPGLGVVGDALFAALQPALGGRNFDNYAVNYPASYNFLQTGDGANDVPMLTTAGLGIAFRAKPAVAAAARWRLDHADLTGLLYAQGYRKAEFAA